MDDLIKHADMLEAAAVFARCAQPAFADKLEKAARDIRRASESIDELSAAKRQVTATVYVSKADQSRESFLLSDVKNHLAVNLASELMYSNAIRIEQKDSLIKDLTEFRATIDILIPNK